jgi:hypothetical protein
LALPANWSVAVSYIVLRLSSPFLLYYSKFMVLLMVDKRKLHRKTRFPVMYVFKILVEKEINMSRKLSY